LPAGREEPVEHSDRLPRIEQRGDGDDIRVEPVKDFG
jgi:hypothetical protein